MNRISAGACLLLATLLLPAQGQDELKRARNDVVRLAARVAAGKELTAAEIAAHRATHDELILTMLVFRHRKKGGLGVGPPADNDGIEAKLIALSKRPLTPAQLKKEGPDLAKMAAVIRAVAQVSSAYAPPNRGLDTHWRTYTASLDTEAEGLARAVAAGSPAALRKAADGVNNACARCHTVYRERAVFGPGQVVGRGRVRPEILKARFDVLALADKVAAGKAITRAEVAEFRKEHDDLFDVMLIYKPRAKGGLGVGKKGSSRWTRQVEG